MISFLSATAGKGRMFSNHINLLLKQAIVTFSNKQENFSGNLNVLKNMLSQTKPSDVGLDPKYMTHEYWMKEDAPINFIQIYEDDVVQLCMFLLRPGMRLPLHNHPDMYGLLKVLFGNVTISSFTIKTDPPADEAPVHYSRDVLRQRQIEAKKETDLELSSASECCILEPNIGNLHEIQSTNGPAGFFDILAPPYSHDDESGPRRCSYFDVGDSVAPDMYMLHEIQAPHWFWSQSCPYTGPPLIKESQMS